MPVELLLMAAAVLCIACARHIEDSSSSATHRGDKSRQALRQASQANGREGEGAELELDALPVPENDNAARRRVL